MVVDRNSGEIAHAHVRDLPEYTRAADAVVINDSRVLPARLIGRREKTGGRWEGLFLRDEDGLWILLGKTRGKIQPGERVVLEDHEAKPVGKLGLLTKLEDGCWVARCEDEEHYLDLLQRLGRVPLPHYIRDGEMEEDDRQRYQTVFAEVPGSVAAPTAGLHFTPELLQRVEEIGAKVCRLTLHVGVGTFRPITTDSLEEHQMHREWGELDEATAAEINRRRAAGGRCIAVGTTSTRLLESAAADGALQPFRGETDLFIRPPHNFQAVDALLTNFHLPRSTLLVLVQTFGGDELIRRAYEVAIEEGYRFYSYGDAMLIV